MGLDLFIITSQSDIKEDFSSLKAELMLFSTSRKNGLQAEVITLCAWMSSSSQAKVTSKKSLSSLNVELMLFSTSQKNGLQAEIITLCAWICSSSQAKVTSTKSFSSLKAELMLLFSKSFHRRQNLSVPIFSMVNHSCS